MATWQERFALFVDKKTRATTAAIPGYMTAVPPTDTAGMIAIGNEWTTALFDGPFFLSAPPEGRLPAISTVFVRTADGNTGSDRPIELGGGLTDKHLIYEGLSGVAADAILTGALTIKGEQMIFGVFHPELVALRASLGLPRFPIQVVATRSGNLEIESSLIYNVPDLKVFILTEEAGAATLQPMVESRPWITVISGGETSDVLGGLAMLKAKYGVTRVSSVGGRTMTTELIDWGVVRDIYLTTSPITGGEPDTPFYTGSTPLDTTTILRKAGQGDEAGVTFEHLVLA